jgi:hypothetical protein
MMTTASRESRNQAGTIEEGRARQPALPAQAVNPVWTGLALGGAQGQGVVQRKCAACAGGGSCPACDEEQHAGGA